MSDAHRRRIILGVTSGLSLRLLQGFPEYLATRGWDVHLVSGPVEAGHDFVPGEGVSHHVISMRREPRPAADARSLLAWIRLIRRLRPSAVFLGTPKAALLGTVAAAVCRTPVRLYHVRGLRLETATGLLGQILAVTERVTFVLSTSAVAVSASLRDALVVRRLGAPKKIIVLGKGSSNGVDVEAVDRAARAFAGDETRSAAGLTVGVPVIGYVGRMSPDKGIDDLIAASSLLVDRGVAHQLLLIGGDEGVVASGLFTEAQHHGVQLIHLDHVEGVSKYYGLMDVFCLPTLREGFPNVVLEASAAGLPVVTTRATGAVDSVVDGVTGELVDVADPSGLADAFERLLGDASLRSRMGTAGRDWVAREFDRSVVWERTATYLETQVR